jgi:hypothetical protein
VLFNDPRAAVNDTGRETWKQQSSKQGLQEEYIGAVPGRHVLVAVKSASAVLMMK